MLLAWLLLLPLVVGGVGFGIILWLRSRRLRSELARLTAELQRSRETLEVVQIRSESWSIRVKELDAEVQQLKAELAVETDARAQVEKHLEVAAKGVQDKAELEHRLQELRTALDEQRQRADALAKELEHARRAPVDTLEVLRNDPAVGPGQYETLRLMYERFTEASVLETK